MTARPGDRFPSMAAFFAADDRRRLSGESDFGCWWLGGNLNRTTYRVSAVKDTGEIYIVRLSQGLRDEPAGEVELLAVGLTVGSYDDAERLLSGWAEACGTAGSLDWIRGRFTPSPVPS